MQSVVVQKKSQEPQTTTNQYCVDVAMNHRSISTSLISPGVSLSLPSLFLITLYLDVLKKPALTEPALMSL
jgi:hypothetical protein